MSDHPIFQRQGYALSPDVIFVEETEPAFSEELDELTGVMRHDLREASLIEAMFCNSRGLQIRWASQDVVKLDVRDEEMVINLNREIHNFKIHFNPRF